MASDQLKLIDAGGVPVRLALVVLTLLAFFGAWRAARWYAGSEIALAAPLLPEGAGEAAETATRLSPSDPLAHWSVATLEQRSVGAGDLKSTIAEYEKAVSLSPRDFRLWVDLGRAREQAGDYQGGEKALRRGAELAPFYVWPRWHLGNFLVRRGRFQEGLAELRRVADEDPSKRGMVFDLAWMIYGGDVAAVRDSLGDSLKVDFVSYLVSRGRVDEALQLWSGLSDKQKKESGAIAGTLVDTLITAKRYRAALNLARESANGRVTFEVGKISNGSFEEAIAQGGAGGLFDWHVPNIEAASAALESGNARDGNLSLRINFNATGALDFNITQLVAVEPATQYRLLFNTKANNLKSAATPVVQVLGADGKVLAESAPVAAGKSDWQDAAVDFKTPADVDGITVRITRTRCTAEGGVCPIFGIVWYDNFNLQPLGR